MDGIDAVAAIGGTDIRKVMKSQGPTVNTVILRCPPSSVNGNAKDSKPAAVEASLPDQKTDSGEEEKTPTPRTILEYLIEEVKIDTTPSKSKVAEVLGGPFTFLGQYEEEGIVLMVRNLPDDLEADLRDIYENNEEEEKNSVGFSFADQLSKNFNIKALKAVCFQRDIDTENMTEKRELVEALVAYQKNLPPYNTHQLQPPLHKAHVRGDILVMKVAETEEELDIEEIKTDDDESKEMEEHKKSTGDNSGAVDEKDNSNESSIESGETENESAVTSIPSNDEFFLDYSKDAYIKFASRTDIPEHEIQLDEEVYEEGGEGETEEFAMIGFHDGDEDDVDEEEGVDENDKTAMFNLVMNEVLRQYREENGRGPNTQELLELRANIARELGVEITQDIDGDWDKMAKENTVPSAKKIAFTKEADRVREYIPDANEYPSDRDDEDDEDYEYSDGVARSLVDDYDGKDQHDHDDDRPKKRLKTSDVEGAGENTNPESEST